MLSTKIDKLFHFMDIMYGNDLIDINSEEFENWMKNNPKMASLYIKIAEQELAFVKSKFAKLT